MQSNLCYLNNYFNYQNSKKASFSLFTIFVKYNNMKISYAMSKIKYAVRRTQ